MSYQDNETSIQDGKPIELYRFVIGASAAASVGESVYFLYTSGQQVITATTADPSSETFTPLEIERTAPEQTRELARQGITVTMPRDAGIAQQFIAHLPTSRIYLTIFRKHTQDSGSDFIQFWTGRVKQVTFAESTALVQCEPSTTLLKRRGLRKNYGSLCQHALYDAGCKVDPDDFDTAVDVSAVDGEFITGSGEISGSAEVDWFVSGTATRSNGEVRFIIEQSGDQIRVLTPFNNLLTSETLTLLAGCKRDITTCRDKFDNEENAFLFHVNPKKNPFSTGLA